MIRWAAVVVLACLCWRVARGDEAAGERGDPAGFVFEGTKTFTPAQIARSLKCNPGFLAATRPDAPVSQLLEAVRTRIREGYLHEGFPDVEVAAALSADGQTVAVKIDEGQQYVCGDLQIIAPEGFPTEELRRWLLSPQPPAYCQPREVETPQGMRTQWFKSDGKPVDLQDPLWKVGEPASFTLPDSNDVSLQMERALWILGYKNAKPKLRVEAEAGRQRARLVIDLTDAGSRVVIGEITFEGLEDNTAPEVLKCIGAEPGMVHNSGLAAKIFYRLRDSGRFLNFSTTTRPMQQPGLEQLIVTVKEYKRVPALGQKLSADEEIMLKFAHWMSALPARDIDIEVTLRYEPCEFEAVISPRWGMWGQFIARDESNEPEVRYEFFGDAQQNVHCLPGLRLKALVPATRQRLAFSLNMVPTKGGGDTVTMFGFGVEGHGSGSYPAPILCMCKILPAAAMGQLHGENVQCTLENGVLDVTTEDMRFRIDAESGHLIEMITVQDGPELRMRIVPGAFEQRRRDFTERTARYKDCSDPVHPARAVADFVSAAGSRWAEHDPRSRFVKRLLKRLALTPAFDSVDRAFDAYFGDTDFGEPWNATSDLSGSQKYVYPAEWVVDAVVPPKFWMRPFSRELLLAYCKDPEAGGRMEQIVDSDEIGPLSRWLAAWLCGFVDPKLAESVAGAGTEPLSAKAFRSDIALLTDERYLPGQLALAIASELREMPEDEFSELVGALNNDDAVGERLAQGIRLLRSTGQKPMAEALPTVLEQWWQRGLRELVEARLQEMAGNSAK